MCRSEQKAFLIRRGSFLFESKRGIHTFRGLHRMQKCLFENLVFVLIFLFLSEIKFV